MSKTFKINDQNCSRLLLKDSINPMWKPGMNPDLKYDYSEVYGPELGYLMEDLLDTFPHCYGIGSSIDMLDGGEWDIRLVERDYVDMIELGIRSVFSATKQTIRESAEDWSESLVERLDYFNALPKQYRPSFTAADESRWLESYLPHECLTEVAKLLSKGFPEGAFVSPRVAYAENREINLHEVPADRNEAEDFICGFTFGCSELSELVDSLEWDEDELTLPRKIFEIEIGLYLPVITPEFMQLSDEDQTLHLPACYSWS
jgi:hypothetical protein